jgi:uncharacterized membrane protein
VQQTRTGEPDSIAQTVQDMIEFEQREKTRASLSDRIAEIVTRACGSMGFAWLNAAWFAIWIGGHLVGLFGFDPFPYGLLTMIVSLEAIGLAIFVLISENRQAMVADKRAKLDLEINLIAEQEITKLLQMVARIEERLGTGPDPEAEQMLAPTRVQDIAEQIEALEGESQSAAAGTSSGP